MANEIIMNEGVIEATEELVTTGPCKAVKIGGGVALLALAGFGLYKAGKWVVGKIKAKKEQNEATSETETSAE